MENTFQWHSGQNTIISMPENKAENDYRGLQPREARHDIPSSILDHVDELMNYEQMYTSHNMEHFTTETWPKRFIWNGLSSVM